MTIDAKKMLIVLPNWVGDAVLATAALRSLREGYRESHIDYLIRPHLTELIGGCPWFDKLYYWPARKKGFRTHTTIGLVKELRSERFDAAVLLANSFRSAVVTSLSKIPRRIGYDRDGRGVMLTDKLLPDRYNGRLLPISAVKYYLNVANYLACDTRNHQLELFTEPRFEHEVESLFVRHGKDPDKGFAVINPGASYGPAKCWDPRRFAEVGDHLAQEYDFNVVIACGPREVEIARDVQKAMTEPAVALTDPVIGLGTLKALIARCGILVTNDTGPRHFGPAFGVPVVTVFGSTDPRWTETLYPRERQVRVEVECGPCMKRSCPEKHHRCMTQITSAMVIEQIGDLLSTAETNQEVADEKPVT